MNGASQVAKPQVQVTELSLPLNQNLGGLHWQPGAGCETRFLKLKSFSRVKPDFVQPVRRENSHLWRHQHWGVKRDAIHRSRQLFAEHHSSVEIAQAVFGGRGLREL